MRRRTLYGPVNSRRFGRSLGVDLVPHKICSYDCNYCQLGRTTDLVATPREFVAPDEILADLDAALSGGAAPDVITLAGSGEPTLYRDLGAVVVGIKARTEVPLLLLTNGSLLWDPAVRDAVREVDLLEPSLDAPDETTWRRINRPPEEHGFDRMVEGIRDAARVHPGRLRVEVMLLRGLNDAPAQLQAFAALLATIPKEGVDINSPVRPVPEADVFPCDLATLERARRLFGVGTEIIATRQGPEPLRVHRGAPTADGVLASLERRPQTLADLAAGLAIAPSEVARVLEALVEGGRDRRRAPQRRGVLPRALSRCGRPVHGPICGRPVHGPICGRPVHGPICGRPVHGPICGRPVHGP
ncbi:MAG: radical SAM protein, partial [Pseudomonadota bacterium]